LSAAGAGGPSFVKLPERGCPVLALFARAGSNHSLRLGFSCLPDYIAPTALTTCTLSSVPVIDDCRNCAPGAHATASFPILEETRQQYSLRSCSVRGHA
jgi:hypothetical protein